MNDETGQQDDRREAAAPTHALFQHFLFQRQQPQQPPTTPSTLTTSPDASALASAPASAATTTTTHQQPVAMDAEMEATEHDDGDTRSSHNAHAPQDNIAEVDGGDDMMGEPAATTATDADRRATIAGDDDDDGVMVLEQQQSAPLESPGTAEETNKAVVDPRDEIKHRKLLKLLKRSKHPSFLKLLTANYDTEESDDDSDDDDVEGRRHLVQADTTNHDFDGMTMDVDLVLGLKTKEHAEREQQQRRMMDLSNDDDGIDATILNEGYYDGRVGLALPEDAHYLSELHCWIRNSLEFFSATRQDAAQKQSVVPGKVGIRCIYCQRASEEAEPGQSVSTSAGCVSYPATLAAIFTACQQKPQTHWETCPNLPDEQKAILRNLMEENAATKRQRRDLPTATYYFISAKRLGLVNHDTNGIRFGRDLKLSPLSFAICRKQYEKEPSDNAGAAPQAVVSEPRITASADAEAVLAEALLEPDNPETNLSRSSDKANVTDYFFLLIRQMQLCFVLPLDFTSRGKRAQGLRLGLAGFCCRHCADYDPQSSCRCFTSAADNLSSSISNSFAGHLLKCPRVSSELKKALNAYKKLHARQLTQLPYGSQRRLIHELWTRLRAADLTVEEMTQRMESMPATLTQQVVRPEPVQSAVASPKNQRKQRPKYDETVDTDLGKYPEAFPNCLDEATQAILAHAASDWPDNPSEDNLIIPSERYIVSEFLYLALRQLVAAQPGNDSRARRVAGIQCRHCMDQPQRVSPAGRSFPSAPDNFASALNTSLNQHFQNCPYVPADMKIALSNVRKLHSAQCSSLRFGAQRRFFNILFDRLSQMTVHESELSTAPIVAAASNETRPVSHDAMLFEKGFMQVGMTFVCTRCRMVPLQFQSKNSMFAKQPTAAEMKAHDCKGQSFDLSLVQDELRMSVETELDGQSEILSTDAFMHLLRRCVGDCDELFEIFLSLASSLQQSSTGDIALVATSGLGSKFPDQVDFESVAAAFAQLSPSTTLLECPHFLRFVMFIAPALQLPMTKEHVLD